MTINRLLGPTRAPAEPGQVGGDRQPKDFIARLEALSLNALTQAEGGALTPRVQGSNNLA